MQNDSPASARARRDGSCLSVLLGGSWELETFSAPFVRHSHKFCVKHPKVSGEFEVSKVVSTTSENGFIRTVHGFGYKISE